MFWNVHVPLKDCVFKKNDLEILMVFKWYNYYGIHNKNCKPIVREQKRDLKYDKALQTYQKS